MSVLVSVIIPTYGRPQFLEEAVDSVLAQSIDDLECIVVDDASPTPIELPADPRVHLVRRARNGGAPAARNSGIQAAAGQYVTFLDDDDLLTPDRLEIGLRAVERAPIGLCLLGSLDDPPSGPGHQLDGDVSDTILDSLVPNVGQALISREGIRLFDETLRACEDLDWWLRMTQATSVATEPEVGYLFRRHLGVRHGNEPEERIEYRRALLEKHRGYFDTHPRAEAFQLRRIATTATRTGRKGEARAALWRSLRLNPSLAGARDLARSWTGSSSRPG